MTTSIFTMKHTEILKNMPLGMKTDRPLPWTAALRAISPLISQNDRSRAAALPLFSKWIRDRDDAISVEQAAWMWTHFAGPFARDLKNRFTQWAYDPSRPDVMGPIALLGMQVQILLAMHYRPWVARLQLTFLGRVQWLAMRSLGLGVFFVLCLLGFVGLYWLAEKALPPVLGVFGI